MNNTSCPPFSMTKTCRMKISFFEHFAKVSDSFGRGKERLSFAVKFLNFLFESLPMASEPHQTNNRKRNRKTEPEPEPESELRIELRITFSFCVILFDVL